MFIVVWHIPRTTTLESWIITLATTSLILKLNSTKLSWLISEIFGSRDTHVTFSYDPGSGKYTTEARRIEPGDMVCLKSKYDKESNSGVQDASPPSLVMALRISDSGRLELGFMHCHQTESVDPGEHYIRYKSNNIRYKSDPFPGHWHNRQLADETANALTDLISFLPPGEPVRENLLVNHLVRQNKNSDLAVRQAIRIALFVEFIVRQQTFGHAVEFLKILSRGKTGGHPSCWIELTDLGLAWINSETFPMLGNDQPSTTIQGDVHQLGDQYINHGSAGAMGHDNTVQDSSISQVNQGAYNASTESLACELAKLTATLKKHATDPSHYHALGNLTSAQLAAEKGDASTVPAHLARLGKTAKWVLDIATPVGIPVAISAIKKALHLPN